MATIAAPLYNFVAGHFGVVRELMALVGTFVDSTTEFDATGLC